MSARPEIAFVILTWNSSAYITKCLESIASFADINTRVIVVDNGSKDSTLAQIEAASRKMNLELIKNSSNLGTTVSRNQALESAGESPFVCILDSDTVVSEAAFKRMISALQSDDTIGIIGPSMQDGSGTLQFSGRNLPTLGIKLRKAIPFKSVQAIGEDAEKPTSPIVEGLQDVPYLLSACWLMRAETVNRIGKLDENIFYAPEDVDYCVRAWGAGYRVVRCWDASITHEYQRISKKKLLSTTNLEHIKGLVYYFKKYGYLFRSEKLTHTWRLYKK